jgi:peptide/nickel transport system permease protein
MVSYITRRLILSAFVLIIVSLIVFFAMRILPGDPILLLMSSDQLDKISLEEVERIKHEYGLDKPIILQYFDWIGGLARGDLGQSLIQKEAVMIEIKRRLPITLHLGLLSTLLAVIIGVPAGIISAVRRGKWADTVVTILANIGITIPVFWLGIMLIYVIGLKLGWLPLYGYTSPFENLWLNSKEIIMPVFCLSIFSVASNARQTRSSMLEVMYQDYIRTAWSKGLRERVVIMRHALKNGLIPIVTLIGMQFRFVIGGSVLVETVFNIPGIGRLLVNGVLAHDYPVVQAVILLLSLVVVFSNLIVDLAYGWLDPRIRYS